MIKDYHQDSITHHLFQMEFTHDREKLKELVERVRQMITDTPGHKRLSEKIAQWFSAAMFRNLQLELPLDQVINYLEGISHMLSDALEKWRRESKEEGFQEGVEEGIR